MKFVSIPVFEEKGSVKEISVNPDLVLMLIGVPIPTGIFESDGTTPIVKEGTGIVLSNGNVLPCQLDEKEIQKLLEGV